MNTCIIIPCFNEFNRLPVLEFTDYIQKNNIHFYFVNDGSTDNTLQLINSLKNQFSDKITIDNCEVNIGKAEAVRKAVLKVIKNPIYKYIGYFDADLATPLNEIAPLLNEFKVNPNINLVIGSRIKRLGSMIDRKYSRFLFGRIFATIISEFILKTPIYDTQCGAKIFKKEVALIMFNEKFLTKWIFDVEILLRLKVIYGKEFMTNKIYEFPLNTWVEKGDSKIKFTDFLKVPKDIILLKMKYKS